VEKFPFLSDEWTAEVKRLHGEVVTESGPPPQRVRMNLILTESPLSEDPIDAHLDTTSGELILDTGHLESPDLTVTVDYETAKAILVEGNAQVAMQAFMSGRIKIEGDMTLLLAMQTAPLDAAHQELAARVREITA
jgi:putative sterol carrier protein